MAGSLLAPSHVVAAGSLLLAPGGTLRGLLAPLRALRHLLAPGLLVTLVRHLHKLGNLLHSGLALLRSQLTPLLDQLLGHLRALLAPLLRGLGSLLAPSGTLRSLLAPLLGALGHLLAPGGTLRSLLGPLLRSLGGLLGPLRALGSLGGNLRALLGSMLAPLGALAGTLTLPLVALPGLTHVVAVAVLLDCLGSLHGSGRLRSLGSTLRLLGKHGKSGQNRDK